MPCRKFAGVGDWRRGGAGGIRGGSAPPWWFGRCRGFRPLLAEGNEAVALVPLYRERGAATDAILPKLTKQANPE